MFQNQIEEGVKYLDINFPGWEGKIDLEKLDCASYGICVLAQVVVEREARGEHFDYPSNLGFNIEWDYDCGEYTRKQAWNQLTEEWKAFIRYRRMN